MKFRINTCIDQQNVVVVIKMLLCKVVLIVFLAVPLSGRYYEESYSIPEPEIQAFYPKGFRVSIEDSPGVRLFAFHGSINKELLDLAAGDFSKDILHKRNGKWTFEERNVRLRVGDVINFWLFVIKDDLGYRMDDRHFEVEELLSSPFETSRPVNPRPPTPEKDQSQSTSCSTVLRPPPNDDRKTYLQICELTVLNATRALLEMQVQIDSLREENERLTNLLHKYPDAKKLRLSGRIPPDDSADTTVRFIIREKLDLNPDISSAVRNNDNSITFEVTSVAEKMEILQVAKDKLRNSRIVIS